MTSITPETWDRFAEATLSHDQGTAAPMGRDLAAQTPPIALARKARHRKPNRRRITATEQAGSVAR